MMQRIRWVLLNRGNMLRNGWWMAAFLALIATILIPNIIVSAQFERSVAIWEQGVIVAIATVIIQALRRRPITEVTGPLDSRTLRQLGAGLGAGALLMLAPAGLLWATGLARFDIGSANPADLLAAVVVMAAVAITEELLFRGVLLQRLAAGIGNGPAQVGIGLLFVLTHLDNPGMDGATRLWAGVNIFLASMLFGLAYLRTRGLALPIGLHFMANVMQGIVLGFGVSGNEEPSVLTPAFNSSTTWLTGGQFGLEASLPGLIAVTLMLAFFAFDYRRRRAGS